MKSFIYSKILLVLSFIHSLLQFFQSLIKFSGIHTRISLDEASLLEILQAVKLQTMLLLNQIFTAELCKLILHIVHKGSRICGKMFPDL